MSQNVKVAVRIRPFSERELENNAKCVLDVADSQVCVTKPFPFYKSGAKEKNLIKIDVAKTFSFDSIFWSLDDGDPRFSDQHAVYTTLGPSLVEDAFSGFNCCIFAYGQTGSGKTFTMLGKNDSDRKGEGIIPRLCHDIFNRVASNSSEMNSTKVVVSYMEIYNEKVFDLLDPKAKQNLKVREHPTLGPYVDGLKQLAVSSYEDIEQLLISGNRQRTVAATSMNIESSRSHAIFMLRITQTSIDAETGISGEKVSKVSLVDLAGSERASKSGAVGERLKEGSNINKSLTTLGLVIAALADQSSSSSGNNNSSMAPNKQPQNGSVVVGKQPNDSQNNAATSSGHIPYRDSVLTWLLRDCLGGNTRTVLVATLSPAEDNLGETISTLRYADRAKRIVNRAVVNEDPTAKIIRELREEVDALKGQLASRSNTPLAASSLLNFSTMTRSSSSVSGSSTDLSLIDRLDASERLMTEMTRTWEDRLLESDRLKTERTSELEKLGIKVESSGIRLASSTKDRRCFLVNLNADPSLNEMLVYYLNQPGVTLVCKLQDESEDEDEHGCEVCIKLNGIGVMPQHAEFSVDQQGAVKLRPFLNTYTLVNDALLTSELGLKHGDMIQFGTSETTMFRLNCPKPKLPPTNENEGLSSKERTIKPASLDQADVTVAAIEKQYEMLSSRTNNLSDQACEVSSIGSRESFGEASVSGANSVSTVHHVSTLNSTNANDAMSSTSSVSAVTGRISHYQQQLMIQNRLEEDRRRRQERLQSDLKNLRRQLIRTNTMVYEANLMASQFKIPVSFAPTLQIPPSMLEVSVFNANPSNRPSLLSEPAVLATSQRGTGFTRTLALSEFESVLTACRDSLADGNTSGESSTANPGWQLASVIDESSPTGSLQLVGVANIYLSALFYTIPFKYSAPIISTLGETCGHVTVCIARRPDDSPLSRSTDSSQLGSDAAGSSSNLSSSDGLGSSTNDFNTLSYYSRSRGIRVGDYAQIRVNVQSVSGLDVRSVAMARYSFWDSPMPTAVQPVFFRSMEDTAALITRFDDEKSFRVKVSDEFIDYCADGALPIQIWQYPVLPEHEHPSTLDSAIQSAVPTPLPSAEDHRQAIFRRLLERWQEVTGQLDLSVEIHEMKDASSPFTPVPVSTRTDDNFQHAGGVYKLTAGKPRSLFVQVVTRSAAEGEHVMPLQIDSIQGVQLGAVVARPNIGAERHPPLDTYQRIDLDILMKKWRDALNSRTKYLDDQLRTIGNNRALSPQDPSASDDSSKNKSDPSYDARREALIFQEWSLLVAEKELSEEPEPGCGLPGAEPGDEEYEAFELNIATGHEMHRPVIFLDLPVESLTTGYPVARQNLAGAKCFLDKELNGKFVDLRISQELDGPVGALVDWDSVTANFPIFERPSQLDDKIYAILRVVVRLSHPTQIDVMLRKRLCFVVQPAAPPANASPGKFAAWRSRLLGSPASSGGQVARNAAKPECTQTSVTYDIISNLPLASYDVARRSVLAKMAADPSGTAVNTSAIEQYVQAVQAVESLMIMDKLRQQLALQRCIDFALSRHNVSHIAGAAQRGHMGTPSPRGGLSPAGSVTNIAKSMSDNQMKRSRSEFSTQIPPTPLATTTMLQPAAMTIMPRQSLDNENNKNAQNFMNNNQTAVEEAFPTN